MSKGLRADEEFLREHAAKRTRWQTGTGTISAVVDTQRPAAAPSSGAGNAAGALPFAPSAAAGHPIAHIVEPPLPSKYGNKRTDGYASKREAKRAAALKIMAASGAITDLREQVPYLLVPKAVDSGGRVIERAAHYIADFVYLRDGTEVVEDCKGMRTPEYVLKRKLMLMVHGIRITET